MTPTDALAAAVRDALLAEQPAPLPGVGTLRTAHLPARVAVQADGSRQMLPPGRTVRLDPAAAEPEAVATFAGAFAGRIGLAEAAPLAQATALRTALDAVEARLAVTGEAELPGVGRFGRTSSGVEFAPDRALVAAVGRHYGGLAPVVAPPAEHAPAGLSAAPVVPTRPFWLDDLETPAALAADAPGTADDLDGLVDRARAAGLGAADDGGAVATREAAAPEPEAVCAASAPPPTTRGPQFDVPPDALLERVRALPDRPAARPHAAAPPRTPPPTVRARPSRRWLALPLGLAVAGLAAWALTRPQSLPEVAAVSVTAEADSVAGGRALPASGARPSALAPDATLPAPDAALPAAAAGRSPGSASASALLPRLGSGPGALRPGTGEEAVAERPAPRPGALRRDPPARAAPARTMAGAEPPRRLGVAPPPGVAVLPPRLADLSDVDVDALAGGQVAAGEDAHTFVVLSTVSRAEADALAERYWTAGYRTGVVEASGDIERWRVVVGAFASRAQALRLLDRLPPQAPPDTWLLDLRPLAARR